MLIVLTNEVLKRLLGTNTPVTFLNMIFDCMICCSFYAFVCLLILLLLFFFWFALFFSFWLHLLMAFDITRYPDYKQTFKGP